MTPELKAAAKDVANYQEQPSGQFVAVTLPGMQQLKEICQLVLAEHDETPVTEEWANTLSMKQKSGDIDFVWVLGLSDVGSSVILLHRNNEFGNFWAMYMGGMKLQMIVTRGDVRRLASALGISLKEDEQK